MALVFYPLCCSTKIFVHKRETSRFLRQAKPMRVLDGLEKHELELLSRRIVRQVEEVEAGVRNWQVRRLSTSLQDHIK